MPYGFPAARLARTASSPSRTLRVRPFAPVVEDAHRRHLRAARDARLEPRDDPGDGSAVAEAVHRVAVVVDGVVEVDRLRPERQLGVRVVDAGVDDRHRDARPVDARRPQLRDLHERVALGVEDADLPVQPHALDARVPARAATAARGIRRRSAGSTSYARATRTPNGA